MKIESFDLWSSLSEPMPQRSRLFHLPPIGVGTPFQEALSSYMVRLARAHSVSPLILCNRELLPITDIKVGRTVNSFVMGDAKTLNGLNKYATEAVRGFQQLTLREDLKYCTLLPWQGVLGNVATLLLSPHPRWCPVCFIEWRSKGIDPYWPLLWFTSPATQCPEHGKLLEEQCPHCNKHQPFIPRHFHVDHCSHCGHSLGFLSKKINSRVEFPGKSHSRFASESIAEIIASAPQASAFATHERLIQRLKELVDLLGNGNAAEMHRRLGLREKAVTSWCRDGEHPTINSLLTICYRLNITPTRLLRDELPNPLELRLESFPKPKLDYRKKLTKREKERIQSFLESVLNNLDESPPMVEVAERLGYPKTFLRYWWQKECVGISAKHKAFVLDRSRRRIQYLSEKVEKIAREVFSVSPNATTQAVRKRLAEEKVTLSWNEERPIIRRVRQEFLINPVKKSSE